MILKYCKLMSMDGTPAESNQYFTINPAFETITGGTRDELMHLLSRIALTIQAACRPEYITDRVGGNEFVILLPRKDAAKTAQVLEAIQDSVGLWKSALCVAASHWYSLLKHWRRRNVSK